MSTGESLLGAPSGGHGHGHGHSHGGAHGHGTVAEAIRVHATEGPDTDEALAVRSIVD